MSAYSDWKCGALTDDEYDFICNREAAEDKAYLEQLDAELYYDSDDDEY